MKRGLVQVVSGLTLLTLCAVVLAEDSHPWETATVISQNIGSSVMGECSAEVAAGSVAAPIDRKLNTVVLDTGRYRYSLQEITIGPDWHHFIVLTGNDRIAHEQVKFYRDGSLFVVLGDQGEEHRFCLLHSMNFQ